MGKKSHAKKQRQQAKQMSKPTVKPTAGMPLVSVPVSTILGSKLNTPSSAKVLAMADYSYVRSDIKRIVILLVIIVVLLLMAVVINNHSSLLTTAGSKAAHFLQLQ